MRLAQLYDGVHPVGGPYFSASRERIGDPRERERIAGFLAGGSVVLHTTATDRDWIDPARGRHVPMGFRTDGTWVWSEALAYYVTVHEIAPEAEFHAHMRARGYRSAPVDDDTSRRALAAVHAG